MRLCCKSWKARAEQATALLQSQTVGSPNQGNGRQGCGARQREKLHCREEPSLCTAVVQLVVHPNVAAAVCIAAVELGVHCSGAARCLVTKLSAPMPVSCVSDTLAMPPLSDASAVRVCRRSSRP